MSSPLIWFVIGGTGLLVRGGAASVISATSEAVVLSLSPPVGGGIGLLTGPPPPTGFPNNAALNAPKTYGMRR
jgi:hypothetical protein